MFKTEIFHHGNLNLKGQGFYRKAVRSLIRRGDEVLFVHSPVNGDYKLPGGGIELG